MLKPWEPSWGESYEDIFARMDVAIEDARQRAEGHEAVLVSHQLPIVTVQRYVQGKPFAHASRRCELASVTSLVFDDDVVVDWSYSTPASAI